MTEEKDYSNREIDLKFQGIHDKLDDILCEIKEDVLQRKIANGRVSNLEKWQNRIVGGMVIFSLLVFPLVIYIFQNNVSQLKEQQNNQEKYIKQAITEILSTYDLTK